MNTTIKHTIFEKPQVVAVEWLREAHVTWSANGTPCTVERWPGFDLHILVDKQQIIVERWILDTPHKVWRLTRLATLPNRVPMHRALSKVRQPERRFVMRAARAYRRWNVGDIVYLA